MSYRVLIPTAGTGSRLGELTRYLNKSLVTIGNRPVLACLIEQFPKDVEFVVALGCKGNLVREFLSLAYPRRTFLFAVVNPFEGPGAGLGLSIQVCRKYLQEPFVFCSCDTLVEEQIPSPLNNWMGYAPVEDLRPYRTLRLAGDKVSDICEKGAEGPGLEAYIGLAGIKDYAAFWSAMETGGSEAIHTGEVYGIRPLLAGDIQAKRFTWWDTGNMNSLAKTREKYKQPDMPNILDKPNEAIWFVGDAVIKFSADEAFIDNRVNRAIHLAGYCPPVVSSTGHMYKYHKVEGKVLSEIITPQLFEHFLDHSAVFWQRYELKSDDWVAFRKACLVFYRDKTIQRIQQFYETFQRTDGNECINEESMPVLTDLLERIDWNWLSEGIPGRFHGDYHFENILWSESDKRFTFLDWRQEFGGSLTTGDIYYDLAKLLHGLIVCHELIARDLYKIVWKRDQIRFDLLRRQVLVDCEKRYEKWLAEQKYNVRKVKMLTALIYLNIAALHHYPYCLLLYALGKQMLKRSLEMK
ncbi:MAG TPA: phosphotransferase [Anaerohalosphaeraceae bacterium]|nr:phosphotransferase [Anaerohalosphaeraceae bacterium]